jgi:hypothetical protein
LTDSGAAFLFIAKPSSGPASNPPELSLAAADPAHFHPIFENDAAIVYRLDP